MCLFETTELFLMVRFRKKKIYLSENSIIESGIMSVIFLLIIISLIVAVLFLAAFIWAVKTNQYEDDYTPSVRMLFDEDKDDDT